MPANKIPRVFCIGTADTKLNKLRFLAESIRSRLDSFSAASSLRVKVSVVDVSASQTETDANPIDFEFVSRKEILRHYSEAAADPVDRGEAVPVMSKALENFLTKAQKDGVLAGAVGQRRHGTDILRPKISPNRSAEADRVDRRRRADGSLCRDFGPGVVRD